LYRASAHTEATAAARSAAVSCWAATRPARRRRKRRPRPDSLEPRRSVHAPNLSPSVRRTAGADLSVPARAPSRPHRPRQAHRVRVALAAVFIVFNLPWLVVASGCCSAAACGRGPNPAHGPWIAWQLLGWIYCALVTVYLPRQSTVVAGRETARKRGADPPLKTLPPTRSGGNRSPLPAPCLGDGFLPERRTPTPVQASPSQPTASGAPIAPPGHPSRARVSRFPAGLDGLRVLHLSDLHRYSPRRRRDAGDRGGSERAPARSDRADGRHDRHLPRLTSAVRARVPASCRRRSAW